MFNIFNEVVRMSKIKKILVIFVLSSLIMGILPLPVGAQTENSLIQNSLNVQTDPEFVAGEVIVKFKPDIT